MSKKIYLRLIGPNAGKTMRVGPRNLPFVDGKFEFTCQMEGQYDVMLKQLVNRYGVEIYDGELQTKANSTKPEREQVSNVAFESSKTKRDDVGGTDVETGDATGSEGLVAQRSREAKIREAIEEIQSKGRKVTIFHVRSIVGDDTITEAELLEIKNESNRKDN